MITEVAQDGPAADRGLRVGDVVVEVQQAAISTPAALQEQVDKARRARRASVLMLVQDGDAVRFVPLPVGSAHAKGSGPDKAP